MRAIVAREPGDADVLMFATRPVPTPGPGEVLLRVRAAGVNRPDIMQRQGLARPAEGVTDVLGLEVCGEVAACGAGVPEALRGRRLMSLLPGGGYAPWCVARLDHSLPVPDAVDDDAAAALPEGLFTLWHNLFELGRLRMGETVLIHGAAGGIGTLAIRMAHAAGGPGHRHCGPRRAPGRPARDGGGRGGVLSRYGLRGHLSRPDPGAWR